VPTLAALTSAGLFGLLLSFGVVCCFDFIERLVIAMATSSGASPPPPWPG
jgi:hypothetical protein